MGQSSESGLAVSPFCQKMDDPKNRQRHRSNGLDGKVGIEPICSDFARVQCVSGSAKDPFLLRLSPF